jgi:predicted nucleotidyltransferase
MDLVGLGQFLEDKLGRKVDVVPRRALRKKIEDSILQEVVRA